MSQGRGFGAPIQNHQAREPCPYGSVLHPSASKRRGIAKGGYSPLQGRDSTTNLSRIEPKNRILLPRLSPGGEKRSHSNVAVRLRYFLSPASGERIKVRGNPPTNGTIMVSKGLITAIQQASQGARFAPLHGRDRTGDERHHHRPPRCPSALVTTRARINRRGFFGKFM